MFIQIKFKYVDLINMTIYSLQNMKEFKSALANTMCDWNRILLTS